MTEILMKVALNTIKPKKNQNKTKKNKNKKPNKQKQKMNKHCNYIFNLIIKKNVHITGLLLSSEMCAKYKINKEAQVFTLTYIRITF